jgi:phosphopantetheine--protein transferase-like protein
MAFHHEPIGVDVQQLRPAAVTQRLAERIMCADQLNNWCERGQSVDEFFACWCAAEAIVKHTGDTMWHALQYPFRFVHGRIVCDFPNAPEVQLFQPMPGYCGAVAYSI